jgi:hypothetical protein
VGTAAVPRALDPASLLRAWEAGAGCVPALRGYALLAGAETDLPAPIERLPYGACETLLLALRVGTFGREVSAVAACPVCGQDSDIEFDALDLLDTLPAVDAERTGPETLEAEGATVVFRLPSPADLAGLADKPVSEARGQLLDRCVLTVDPPGAPLSDALAAAVSERMAAADPAADLRLRVVCSACGDGWLAPWDIGGFVWAEVDAAARTLVLEVDSLASRYGWCEADILAMSAPRRRTYLDLA